ncbi:hypothetical protein BDV98DRAFT_577507 [Pterulicium gracile]|uniref:Uncharacterized protein n=1 Tax=Pterulicium gracile TaxID=1884261 RepID=A0A5C3Q0B1_9AGAR|nr:hypothetical protein BDV98DRAFT_577507 [Pterula gracilis]
MGRIRTRWMNNSIILTSFLTTVALIKFGTNGTTALPSPPALTLTPLSCPHNSILPSSPSPVLKSLSCPHRAEMYGAKAKKDDELSRHAYERGG